MYIKTTYLCPIGYRKYLYSHFSYMVCHMKDSLTARTSQTMVCLHPFILFMYRVLATPAYKYATIKIRLVYFDYVHVSLLA